jgi:hypothetical protein
MSHPFDPGYGAEPFRTLCAEYPDASVYPSADFRVEWGPIFHRGRLDGSARILVLGQDPAASEAITRRILVGVAGQRTQGFLAKLGIDLSYVMVNTFVYSVSAQTGGEKHKDDPAIAAYRNRWIDALMAGGQVEAVVALGALADHAWSIWRATHAGKKARVAYAHITHPTQPDSASKGNPTRQAALIKALLKNWNTGLASLHAAIAHPDTARPLVPYGEAFAPGDLVGIPEADLPPGLPAWMRGLDPWAQRTGANATAKRATITVTVPTGSLS